MRVSVVVPVFNEERTIEAIHSRIIQTGIPDEIIFVNDGSTDKSADILEKLTAQCTMKVIHHPENNGKGFAIRTGVQAATGDVVILQDADLEYDPAEYERLLAPFRSSTVKVVYGARFTKRTPRAFYLPHYLANRILTALTNLLFGSKLNDMETGHKVFTKELFTDLNITARGFEFEPEFTAKILKAGIGIFEVPISFNPRNYKQGKKIKFPDAVKAVLTLLKVRLH